MANPSEGVTQMVKKRYNASCKQSLSLMNLKVKPVWYPPLGQVHGQLFGDAGCPSAGLARGQGLRFRVRILHPTLEARA